MEGLIDKFKLKDAIYNMRNARLSDSDMEIWNLINELPVEMDKEKILERMEKLKDTEQDDTVAERISTQIWNKAIQHCISIVKSSGVNEI